MLNISNEFFHLEKFGFLLIVLLFNFFLYLQESVLTECILLQLVGQRVELSLLIRNNFTNLSSQLQLEWYNFVVKPVEEKFALFVILDSPRENCSDEKVVEALLHFFVFLKDLESEIVEVFHLLLYF